MLEEMVASVIFLSTPSARRATLAEARAVYGPPISIHALREEGDPMQASLLFLLLISIHALREEGDCNSSSLTSRQSNFYPRPPRGGRPACLGKNSFRC